jgi:hypothetical protein
VSGLVGQLPVAVGGKLAATGLQALVITRFVLLDGLLQNSACSWRVV